MRNSTFKKRTPLKKKSKSQGKKDRVIDKIKRNLSDECIICGYPAADPAHLLPRSLYGKYYTETWNIVPLCRTCHDLYDGTREFRRSQAKLVEIVFQHDPQAANHYFGL